MLQDFVYLETLTKFSKPPFSNIFFWKVSRNCILTFRYCRDFGKKKFSWNSSVFDLFEKSSDHLMWFKEIREYKISILSFNRFFLWKYLQLLFLPVLVIGIESSSGRSILCSNRKESWSGLPSADRFNVQTQRSLMEWTDDPGVDYRSLQNLIWIKKIVRREYKNCNPWFQSILFCENTTSISSCCLREWNHRVVVRFYLQTVKNLRFKQTTIFDGSPGVDCRSLRWSFQSSNRIERGNRQWIIRMNGQLWNTPGERVTL